MDSVHVRTVALVPADRRSYTPRKLVDANEIRIELEILESRAKPSKITTFTYDGVEDVAELVVA